MNIDDLVLPELKHLAKPLEKILLSGEAIIRLLEQYPTVDKIERVIKNSIGESPARATITKHLVDVKEQIAKQVRLANGINNELPKPVISAFKILMDYGETVANKNLETEFENIKIERETLFLAQKKDIQLIEHLKTQLLLAHSKHDADFEVSTQLKEEVNQLKEKLTIKDEQHNLIIKNLAEQTAKNQVLETATENEKLKIDSFETELLNSKLQARAFEHERDRLIFDVQLLKTQKADLNTKQQADKKNVEHLREMLHEMSVTMQKQITESANIALKKSQAQDLQQAKKAHFTLKRSIPKPVRAKLIVR